MKLSSDAIQQPKVFLISGSLDISLDRKFSEETRWKVLTVRAFSSFRTLPGCRPVSDSSIFSMTQLSPSKLIKNTEMTVSFQKCFLKLSQLTKCTIDTYINFLSTLKLNLSDWGVRVCSSDYDKSIFIKRSVFFDDWISPSMKIMKEGNI